MKFFRITKGTRRILYLDDRLNNFHRLTLRSRLHNFYHRCLLYITGMRYTLKLLHFTYRNVLVLRHFQRCRKVEATTTPKKSTRFLYLDFYKRTWQQSRKLFTLVRTRTVPIAQTDTSDQPRPQPAWYATDIEKTLPPLSWPNEYSAKWNDPHPSIALPISAQQRQHESDVDSSAAVAVENEGDVAVHAVSNPRAGRNRIHQHDTLLRQLDPLSLYSASYAGHHHSHSAALRKRKSFRLRAALRKGFLTIWHAPRLLLWKLSTFFRTRIFKVKLRGLYQQQQIELLREQRRMISSTQTALFLSLANTIDLHTTRELTTLCQHVSRARRKRKMTEEDLACFDQSVTELDNNHETLRHVA